eukprot:scaffold91647_cov15-Tisochrysis_lutea.AAC.1
MERDAKLMRFHGMDTFDRDEIITVWIVCILRGLCKNAIDISTPVHRLLRAACTVREVFPFSYLLYHLPCAGAAGEMPEHMPVRTGGIMKWYM